MLPRSVPRTHTQPYVPDNSGSDGTTDEARELDRSGGGPPARPVAAAMTRPTTASGRPESSWDISGVCGPVAVPEPVREQIVDSHVAVVHVLHDRVWKVPAPTRRGGLVVGRAAEANLHIRYLTEPNVVGVHSRGELDVRDVVVGAVRVPRSSGRQFLRLALVLPPAPQPTRRPFLGAGGLGLVLWSLRHSLLLRCAALAGVSSRLRRLNGTM